MEVVDRVSRTDVGNQGSLEHFTLRNILEITDGKDADLPLRRRRPAPCWSRPGGAQSINEIFRKQFAVAMLELHVTLEVERS